jgi:hypothetical protein
LVGRILASLAAWSSVSNAMKKKGRGRWGHFPHSSQRGLLAWSATQAKVVKCIAFATLRVKIYLSPLKC